MRKRNPEERQRAHRRYRQKHKDKIREAVRKYRKEKPEVSRKAAVKWYWKNRQKVLAKRYKTSVEFIVSLGDSCHICGGQVRLCIDHCHKTGRVRGLLCNACNFALGAFREDSSLLLQAILYLS